MRICQVVISDAFAGTERYACDLAETLAGRGHDVAIVGGGAQVGRHVHSAVAWREATSVGEGVRALRSLGRFDVVHAHLTYGETAAVMTRRSHSAVIVATRHLMTRRGRSLAGRVIAPWLRKHIAAETAISDAVAAAVHPQPRYIVRSGVKTSDDLFRPESRRVTMAQRLEPEKRTMFGVQAWTLSGLSEEGWELAIAGEGSEREQLASYAEHHPSHRITVLGQVGDMPELLGSTGMLLAPADGEPLGLTVLESMAAGLPVVAAAAAGHLETVGRATPDWLFTPDSVTQAAELLRRLAQSEADRREVGGRNRDWQQDNATLDGQVTGLERVYEETIRSTPGRTP